MTPDVVVRGFQVFLRDSWESVGRILGAGDSACSSLQNDWLQANWELLIETQLCRSGVQFLEVYGEVADCNGSSSRVWMPEALPTHRVVCLSASTDPVKDEITSRSIDVRNLTFDGFVHWSEGQYRVSPPFDAILLSSQTDVFIVSCHSVIFDIEPIRA